MAGIASMFIANGATFFVATQVYGDLFVLLILGLLGSFLFALERIAKRYHAFEVATRRLLGIREAYASAGN